MKHICMYKTITVVLSVKLKVQFLVVREIRTCDTNLSCGLNIHLANPRLKLTKQSFLYRGAMLRNKLSDHVKQAPTLEYFKELLEDVFE